MMGVLALTLIPQWLNMSPWLSLVTVAAFVWRIASLKFRWPPLPVAARIFVAFAGLAAVLSIHGVFWGRRAGSTMLAVMLSLKLLEAFRIRDARLLVSVCFFLAAVQFLFYQNALMLFYAGAVILFGLIALMRLQREDAFAHNPARADARVPFANMKMIGKVLAISLPLALSLFFLFPRLSSPLWGMPEYALDGKTGLSDDMSPGSIQSLFIDDSPAFRVEFDGPVPPPQERYWRGPVFWNFDGASWSPVWRGLRNLPPPMPEPLPTSYRYSVQLEPHERHWLFALDYPASLPRDSMLTSDYMLRSRKAITSLKSYDMISEPGFVLNPRLLRDYRAIALDLPENLNPRSRAWIDGMRERYPRDRDLIAAVLNHFNQEEFYYSLDPPPLGLHGIDDFMFRTRDGYCEHYASAFTVLMRMAGIPARVVTGYQGGYFSSAGGYFLVRQSDAHAWSEVWLSDNGWTRTDPTAMVAPERIDRGALDAFSGKRTWYDYTWLRAAKNSLDLAQHYWNSWIVAFDYDRQAGMFKTFGLRQAGATILVSLMFILGGLALIMAWPLLRRMSSRPVVDPAAQLYRQFLQRLEKLGIQSPASEGASELAERAGIQIPERSAAIMRISQMYYLCRYSPGGQRLLPQLRALVSNFR
jgi:transglutaminase-like putative cysteine protease